jgi:hypothetical protein
MRSAGRAARLRMASEAAFAAPAAPAALPRTAPLLSPLVLRPQLSSCTPARLNRRHTGRGGAQRGVHQAPAGARLRAVAGADAGRARRGVPRRRQAGRPRRALRRRPAAARARQAPPRPLLCGPLGPENRVPPAGPPPWYVHRPAAAAPRSPTPARPRQARRAPVVHAAAPVGARAALRLEPAVHRVGRAELHRRAGHRAERAERGRAGAPRRARAARGPRAGRRPSLLSVVDSWARSLATRWQQLGQAGTDYDCCWSPWSPRARSLMPQGGCPHPQTPQPSPSTAQPLPSNPSIPKPYPTQLTQIVALSLSSAAEFLEPFLMQALEWGQAGTHKVGRQPPAGAASQPGRTLGRPAPAQLPSALTPSPAPTIGLAAPSRRDPQAGAVADVGNTIGPLRLQAQTVEGLVPLLEGHIEARTPIVNRPGARPPRAAGGRRQALIRAGWRRRRRFGRHASGLWQPPPRVPRAPARRQRCACAAHSITLPRPPTTWPTRTPNPVHTARRAAAPGAQPAAGQGLRPGPRGRKRRRRLARGAQRARGV